MKQHRKRRPLVYLAIAAVAMGVLAAGLSRLQFLPARPLSPAGPSGDASASLGESPWAEIIGPMFNVALIIAVLLSSVLLVYAIISPKLRKQVLTSLLYLLAILFVLFFLTQLEPAVPPTVEEEPSPEALPEDTGGETPIPEFDPTPPQWLIIASSAGLALAIMALLAGAAWLVWRLRRQPEPALEQVAQQAEEAIEAIRAGADLRDTVLRCYYEMSQVLRQQRGIQRQQAMTPREFERYLEQAGLPGAEIRQLTRLFEKVRYGAKTADEEEKRQALACLTTIVAFCRSGR